MVSNLLIMGYKQFIADGILTPYGTNQPEYCVPFKTPLPEQILGLVPTDPVNTDCVPEPCYTLCVFGTDSNGDKDSSSFLYNFPDADGTATFALQQYNGATWSDVANPMGATEGILYQLGSFASYPSYAGFQIDWGLVETNHGLGIYRFVVITASAADYLISLPFELKSGTCASKNSTVKFEITSQGSFFNFNYTEDNDRLREYDLINTTWDDSVRYYGVTVIGEDETTDTFVNYASGGDKKVFSEKRNTYDVKIPVITLQLMERLFWYGMDSESIKLTDNNLLNQTYYDQQPIASNGSYSFDRSPRKQEIHKVSLPVKSKYIGRFKKS